jgi:hypothetical protein
LHYNAATGLNAGTGNVESIASNLTTLTAESSWEKYNQGPVGFQALGTASGASLRVARVASLRAPAVRPETGPRAAARRSATSASSHRTRSSRARVMIEGLPSTVSAGATLQLAARVAGARPGVSWSVTAGSITSAGLLRAPARPVPGEKLVIRASSAGARDERTVSVAAPDAEPPAPSVYLPEQARATGGHVRALGQPQTMLVGDRLVITTSVGAAGRTTVAAYAGERRLGACSSQTPAGRDTTCIVVLKPAYLHAPIGVVARLSTATGSVTSGRAAARIGPMTMIAQSLARGAGPDSPQFVCSPALASINRRR